MNSYDLQEILTGLANIGVVPEWEIPVTTDTDKLVGVSIGFPRSKEQMQALEGKAVMWVPFLVDDDEEEE
jgi:hypothetical protein